MEHLRVENFLVIKKAELDLNKFCVVIGPQASGKSILAKLVHLFRDFFNESTRKLLLDNPTKPVEDLRTALSNVIRDLMSEYFPGYLTGNHSLSIEYTVAEFSVTVRSSDQEPKQEAPVIHFSDSYIQFLGGAVKEFSDFKQFLISKYDESLEEFDQPLRELLQVSPTAKPYRKAKKYSIFVPASRAYFASLQKQIFSVLRAGVSPDPLILDFGFRYEFSKKDFEKEPTEFFNKIEPLVQSIIVGKYKFNEGEDWLVTPTGKVKLEHASSGQQEALPMLIVLLNWGESMPNSSGFIIEEPEAHLYPKAQKDIVSLFGLFCNQRQLDFFITTHSPYVLAAINNLILAGEVKETVGSDALSTVIDPDYTLNFSDVSAYTIRDGVLHSILDDEERLIGANAIDGVSDEFGEEFEKLLNLRELGERGAYSG